MPKKTIAERFWAKVDKATPNGCWGWLGHLSPKGYGRFYDGNRQEASHRYAYTIFVGPIPDGLLLDHVCRNRACVNPSHLRVVSHRQNSIENSVSFAAQNAAKTECPMGHVYDGQNTYIFPSGWRRCRECKRIQDRLYKARKLNRKAA